MSCALPVLDLEVIGEAVIGGAEVCEVFKVTLDGDG